MRHLHWPFHHHAAPAVVVPAAPHVMAARLSGPASIPGIDYSWSRPAPHAIRAAGYAFAARYLDYGSKGITRAEADALAAAGVWVIVTYETGAEWMLGGWSAGQQAARDCHALGRACRMPEGRPVYFAADFDATPAQLPVINDCLDGAASVLGREATGIYGGLAAVRHAMQAGAARFGWQTCGWSYGTWYEGAQVRQTGINGWLGGQSVDYDVAVATDYGQWMPGRVPGTAPKPAPAPKLTEEEPVLLLAKDVPMPVPIPAGTRVLRFAAAGTAQVQVRWRGHADPDTANLAWADGAQEVTVPAGLSEALVVRLDDGADHAAVCCSA